LAEAIFGSAWSAGGHCTAAFGVRQDMLEAVDVVVSMGCGDTCTILPGRRYEDWVLPDPAGQSLEAVRPIRDEIERRVASLLDQLAVGQEGGG
jgi:arsenate reductase (thioredoxin)